MSTMEDLKARFAAIPRERFLPMHHEFNPEKIAQILAVPPGLEGYPPDEVRALEQRLGVAFPKSFRDWMLLFGKSYVEMADPLDWFGIGRLWEGKEHKLGFKGFKFEGESGPKYDWCHCLRGDGGDDSPVYHVGSSWSMGTKVRVASPSFTQFLESEVGIYEKLPEPASGPGAEEPRPEPPTPVPPSERRPWWRLGLERVFGTPPGGGGIR